MTIPRELLDEQNILRARLGLNQISDTETMLECCCCKKWLPDEEFTTHSKAAPSRRGKRWECKACAVQMKRQWRKANAERQRAYERQQKRAWRMKIGEKAYLQVRTEWAKKRRLGRNADRLHTPCPICNELFTEHGLPIHMAKFHGLNKDQREATFDMTTEVG